MFAVLKGGPGASGRVLPLTPFPRPRTERELSGLVPSIHAYMGLGDPAVLLTMATLMDAAAALTARSHWPRLPASATCRRWHAASAQQVGRIVRDGKQITERARKKNKES